MTGKRNETKNERGADTAWYGATERRREQKGVGREERGCGWKREQKDQSCMKWESGDGEEKETVRDRWKD